MLAGSSPGPRRWWYHVHNRLPARCPARTSREFATFSREKRRPLVRELARFDSPVPDRRLARPSSIRGCSIILARQPCKSSLYHSNFTDGSRRDLGFVPFLTFSRASVCVVRDQSCLRAISQDAGAPNLSPVRAANLLHLPGRI